MVENEKDIKNKEYLKICGFPGVKAKIKLEINEIQCENVVYLFFSDLNFYSIVAGEPHSLRKEFEDFTASFVETIELKSTQDHESGTSETKGEKDEFVSEFELEPGLTANNPIVVTANELINALNNDANSFQNLYNYKWLEVSGFVVSVTHNEIAEITRTYMGETTRYTTGEMEYTIAGVKIKSGLIYWLNYTGYRGNVDIVAEMNMSLCDTYYPQRTEVTVIGYCAGADEENIVLKNGRYE